MSKQNDRLINSIRKMADRNRVQNQIEASRRDMPQLYSVLAMVMWDRSKYKSAGRKQQEIEEIFDASQELWQKLVAEGKDPIEECSRITDIQLKPKEEK